MKIPTFKKSLFLTISFHYIDDFTLNSDKIKDFWRFGLWWPWMAFVGIFGLFWPFLWQLSALMMSWVLIFLRWLCCIDNLNLIMILDLKQNSTRLRADNWHKYHCACHNWSKSFLFCYAKQGRYSEFEPGKAQYSTPILLTSCFLQECIETQNLGKEQSLAALAAVAALHQ